MLIELIIWEQQCYAQTDTPTECVPQSEDYLECLHHTKAVSACRFHNINALLTAYVHMFSSFILLLSLHPYHVDSSNGSKQSKPSTSADSSTTHTYSTMRLQHLQVAVRLEKQSRKENQRSRRNSLYIRGIPLVFPLLMKNTFLACTIPRREYTVCLTMHFLLPAVFGMHANQNIPLSQDYAQSSILLSKNSRPPRFSLKLSLSFSSDPRLHASASACCMEARSESPTFPDQNRLVSR